MRLDKFGQGGLSAAETNDRAGEGRGEEAHQSRLELYFLPGTGLLSL